jgi:hypothetical protein
MLPADRVSGFYSIAHSLRVFTVKEAHASFLPLSLWLQESQNQTGWGTGGFFPKNFHVSLFDDDLSNESTFYFRPNPSRRTVNATQKASSADFVSILITSHILIVENASACN